MFKLGKKLTSILFIAFILIACKNENKEIENINIDLKTWNLHIDLAKINPNQAPEKVKELEKKYGDIIPFFFQNIVRINGDSSKVNEMLIHYFNEKDYKSLMDTVAIAFPETEKITSSIIDVLKHIKYYDTSIAIPDTLMYYTAPLNESAFTRDGLLAVGLDKFLGPNFWPYESVGISSYESKKYISKYIPNTVAALLFEGKYGITLDNKTLLDLMLYEGKKLLFIQSVIPNQKENEILGFTDEQWKWCEDNELLIYDFFRKEKLFYEKSPMKTMRYIAPAPTSQGMPVESPGYTGGYTGYKIIKSYQKKTGMRLKEILDDRSTSTEILQKANYKPNK